MSSTYVFGWSGYIGLELIAQLKLSNHKVFLVGRTPESDVFLDLNSINFDFMSSLQEGDKFIFLSAVSSPDFCAKNYDEAFLINVKNTSLVIDALLDHGVDVLFASSDVVYGETHGAVSEEDDINPQFSYAEMKAQVEENFKKNMHFKAMRLSYVWSPRDKFTQYLINSSKENKSIEVFHPFIRSVICLSDVIDFIVSFISTSENVPAIVNLAGPDFLSRLQMVQAFSACRSLGYTVKLPSDDFFEYRPKQILMRSIYLDKILSRRPHNVLTEIHTKFCNLEGI